MINFDLKEFACPCCGQVHMDNDFLKMIDEARTVAGAAFIITSGYRCEKHNKEIGSESANHTSGCASDIKCVDGPTRIKIVNGLIFAGFRRLGIGKNFIHADCMDRKANAPKSIWLY